MDAQECRRDLSLSWWPLGSWETHAESKVDEDGEGHVPEFLVQHCRADDGCCERRRSEQNYVETTHQPARRRQIAWG